MTLRLGGSSTLRLQRKRKRRLNLSYTPNPLVSLLDDTGTGVVNTPVAQMAEQQQDEVQDQGVKPAAGRVRISGSLDITLADGTVEKRPFEADVPVSKLEDTNG